MARKTKISRQAKLIKVKRGEVYTRLSKREYETRREAFNDPDLNNLPTRLTNYDYDEWTEWGSRGGRPRKWANEAERKRAERIRKKLIAGQPLTYEERELLGLIKKRPGAYKSELGRPMTSAERKRKQRAKK